MDPLSDVLRLLEVEAAYPCRLEAAAPWALRFAEYEGVRVGAVLSGHGWLTVGTAAPRLLHAGDCYLLTDGNSYTVGSDLETEPADGNALFESRWPDTVRYRIDPDDAENADPVDQFDRGDKAGRTVAVSGAVSFDPVTAALLLAHLPPSVTITADSPRARVLHPVLRLLGDETSLVEPGSGVMRRHLTQILFVQILRTLIEPEGNDRDDDGERAGWLGALADRRIGAALALMHQQPTRAWTVPQLAAEVHMSRSAFAQQFREKVGLAPLDYLVRWRMQSAGRILRSTDRTVSSVATEFGYSSESVFSRAFKRVMGRSPSHHRV